MDEVVERARSGEEAAVEALLARVAPAAHRFALRMCRNVHDAEDVLQETLLAVATHLPEFEGRASLSSWVFALARSACARRRRGLKNLPPVDDAAAREKEDESPSPERSAEDRELASALSRALDGLSDEHREVILLRDVEELTAAEAASAIGISVDALKSRLHRAREALRQSLAPVLERGAPPPSPRCPAVAELWSKKLDGDLRAEDCAEMQRHLDVCPACRSACESLRRALVACKHSRTSEVRPEVQERVREALKVWAAGVPR